MNPKQHPQTTDFSWNFQELSNWNSQKKTPTPKPIKQKNPADFVQALEVLLIHLLYIAD